MQKQIETQTLIENQNMLGIQRLAEIHFSLPEVIQRNEQFMAKGWESPHQPVKSNLSPRLEWRGDTTFEGKFGVSTLWMKSDKEVTKKG
jgi:hypothetical protein